MISETDELLQRICSSLKGINNTRSTKPSEREKNEICALILFAVVFWVPAYGARGKTAQHKSPCPYLCFVRLYKSALFSSACVHVLVNHLDKPTQRATLLGAKHPKNWVTRRALCLTTHICTQDQENHTHTQMAKTRASTRKAPFSHFP